MRIKTLLAGLSGSLLMAVGMPLMASAATSTVVVTPGNTQGWSSEGTRTNGSVSFVSDSSAPLGVGALSLITGASTQGTSQDKAIYMHSATVPLASVNTLGYSSKQNSASFVSGMPSYQLPVCLYGVTPTGCVASPNTTTTNKSFATLVYEPYVSEGNSAVQTGVWQTWDVGSGKLWSTRTEGILTKSQGEFTYSLAQLKAGFPNAVVTGYGVNVGSNNPNYNTEVDAFTFNETTFDFEPTVSVSDKDACKNDGWKTSNTPVYKNQGDCVSSFASKNKANGNPVANLLRSVF